MLEVRSRSEGRGRRKAKARSERSAFNVPALIALRFHAPYFHDGSAGSLQNVFKRHLLPGGQTIRNTLAAVERATYWTS
jgi:hypothetical protein